jgi:5,10-methylenetetrahydromethanopterin reductase
MKFSCAFAPSPRTPDLVAAAEDLGYFSAWFNDSPSLYSDVWMTSALSALRTQRIGLGVAVSVPSLRHVMTTASSIATLDDLAPGRVRVAFGTGLTGRLTLGQKPMRWSDVESYVVTLRALLRGDICEWDGAKIQMMQGGARRSDSLGDVGLYVSADGPRGFEIAGRIGDGVFSTGRLLDAALGSNQRALLIFGTVLESMESPESKRAQEAAGPAVAAALHAIESRHKSLDRFPGGDAWVEAASRLDPATRHLHVHRGHLEELNEVDAHAWPEAQGLVKKLTVTGSVDEIRERVTKFEAAGVSELVYQPVGPNLIRELTQMAETFGLPTGVDMQCAT